MFNITRHTVAKWIREGRINAIKLPGGRYRIPESEVKNMEVVKAVVFKHDADVKPLLEAFNQMVNECMAYALKNNISSPMET
ncbi:excisionase family DNA-binding protein [Candidatus Bathyarchaeota archaeon]|nr:excisionase family DNA-binding protein [Candidatus Bathyarchaeota archaeon]